MLIFNSKYITARYRCGHGAPDNAIRCKAWCGVLAIRQAHGVLHSSVGCCNHGVRVCDLHACVDGRLELDAARGGGICVAGFVVFGLCRSEVGLQKAGGFPLGLCIELLGSCKGDSCALPVLGSEGFDPGNVVGLFVPPGIVICVAPTPVGLLPMVLAPATANGTDRDAVHTDLGGVRHAALHLRVEARPACCSRP